MIKKISSTTISLSIVSFLALTACQSTNSYKFTDTFKNGLSDKRSQTETRMATIANEAIKSGNTAEAEAFYEKLYLRDSRNPEIALNYAKALRKTNKKQRAIIVLSPFLSVEKPEILIALEYASLNLEQGYYDRTTIIVQEIINDKKAQAFYPNAYNLMGVIADIQNEYTVSKEYYQNALEYSPNKKLRVNIMNNMALSLAHQGYFDDSLTLLRQTRLLAPEKLEVSKNIKIVLSIREKTVSKPKRKKADAQLGDLQWEISKSMVIPTPKPEHHSQNPIITAENEQGTDIHIPMQKPLALSLLSASNGTNTLPKVRTINVPTVKAVPPNGKNYPQESFTADYKLNS